MSVTKTNFFKEVQFYFLYITDFSCFILSFLLRLKKTFLFDSIIILFQKLHNSQSLYQRR